MDNLDTPTEMNMWLSTWLILLLSKSQVCKSLWPFLCCKLKASRRLIQDHERTFEGFVTAPKYSCDSTINRKMTSYEALTSSDVLISRSDNRLDNFIRLLLNSPLESHWIRGLKLTSKFRAVQFWVNWKKMTTKSERSTSVSSSTVWGENCICDPTWELRS